MIRVLQMAGLNRGGLETFVMNVYRKINRDKIQFDFLTHTPEGDYAEEIKTMGGRIYGIPQRNKGFVAYYKVLDSFFFKHAHEYQAVHFHVASLSMASALYYAKKYGVQVRILHAHSSSISGSKLHYIFHYGTKLFVKYLATDYLGCSDKALDWLYNYTGVRHRAVMVNNGVDVDSFKYNITKRILIRNKLNISDFYVIGHIGRFSTVKNHKFLISVFHHYHRKNPKTKLLLVGIGELMESIKKQVSDLGLNNSVLFLGVRSDISDLLQAFDIFVMPSLFEGLPVSLVEAQAAGLPILATDVISHDTIMTSDFHYMSLNKPAEEWANKIDEILSSYNRKDTSESIVKKGFAINTTVSYLSNLYLRSIGDYE